MWQICSIFISRHMNAVVHVPRSHPLQQGWSEGRGSHTASGMYSTRLDWQSVLVKGGRSKSLRIESINNVLDRSSSGSIRQMKYIQTLFYIKHTYSTTTFCTLTGTTQEHVYTLQRLGYLPLRNHVVIVSTRSHYVSSSRVKRYCWSYLICSKLSLY